MKALFFLIKFLQQNILRSCSLFTVSQAPGWWSRYQDFDRINQKEEMMEVQSVVFIPAKAPNHMDGEGPNSEAKHDVSTNMILQLYKHNKNCLILCIQYNFNF